MNRRFCVTGNKYIGLVPAMAEVGDSVCLIAGAPVPYLLRSCKATAIDDGGRSRATWKFVGDAYIHGLMKGELWDESKAESLILS